MGAILFSYDLYFFLQLFLFFVLGIVSGILAVIGLVQVVIGGLAVLFAQALDEFGETVESTLAVVVDDLVGVLGEELDGREALDLDVLKLV